MRIAFDGRIPVIIDGRLRETDYGALNGRPKAIVDSMRKDKITEPFPGEESYEQAIARVCRFYSELKENHSDKTVLIVGHRVTQFGLGIFANGRTIEDCLDKPFEWQPCWKYSL